MNNLRRRVMVSAGGQEYPLGIWAYYANGSIRNYDSADSNAIGVAVVTADCSFVMDKTRSRLAMSSNGSSGANAFNQLDIVKATNFSSAIVDLDGYNNTLKIISHLTSLGFTSPAISYCMSQFDGNGYLGAFGEWNAVYTNLSDVNSMLTKIGGTQVQTDWYTMTSTLYVDYATFPAAVDRRNGGYSIYWTHFDYNDIEVRSFRTLQIPMYSITITITGDSVSGITVTVTDSNSIAHSGTTDSNGVVRLTGVANGSAKVSVSGYQLTNSSITINASSKSFTCGLVSFGVWAYYSDGSIRDYANADSNAIGVAIVTADCSFVIDKNYTNSNSGLQYGGMYTDFSTFGVTSNTDSSLAESDYNGEENTILVINNVSTCPAATACRAAFGGKGYVGSLGEWWAYGNNKAAVDNMMTKIGGSALTFDTHYTSTQRGINEMWGFMPYTSPTQTRQLEKNYNQPVRAFMAL